MKTTRSRSVLLLAALLSAVGCTLEVEPPAAPKSGVVSLNGSDHPLHTGVLELTGPEETDWGLMYTYYFRLFDAGISLTPNGRLVGGGDLVHLYLFSSVESLHGEYNCDARADNPKMGRVFFVADGCLQTYSASYTGTSYAGEIYATGSDGLYELTWSVATDSGDLLSGSWAGELEVIDNRGFKRSSGR